MRLSDWLKQNGKTVAWLAEQVGRDRSFLTRVKNGEAKPSVDVAAAIQRVTGGAVTAVDYVTDAEEAAPECPLAEMGAQ
ncbi:helix-turn-helix domain-containing protein [Methylobacterium dankookense]|uniref:HTH cro/C1-type domain-containing protein n=1 Tax=Methylobacterium dankookense TaxID=560405 RepID=A0A564G3L8_9HYPH|nr:helix-turn-helix transcriptional regulator [Methylobacterium dankookense]GJD59817.1 hypothetical protein IFDJLNFL_5748 [Methylobacterium dankookense]VUF15075.1 hypothetical protein MTDSW087_04808 [Methylobacterium dankookense]